MTQAALGLRAHSGWATLVVVAGTPNAGAVTDRRRIELVGPGIPKQPYHAAAQLNLGDAEEFIKYCADRANHLAEQAVRAVIADMRVRGYEILGGGILLGSGRLGPTLAATLVSHALIHAAEGELFRCALIHAVEQCGLPVTGVRERDLWSCGAADFGLPIDALERCIAEMGRSLGPPWRQDEKYAALAGWLALTAASRR